MNGHQFIHSHSNDGCRLERHLSRFLRGLKECLNPPPPTFWDMRHFTWPDCIQQSCLQVEMLGSVFHGFFSECELLESRRVHNREKNNEREGEMKKNEIPNKKKKKKELRWCFIEKNMPMQIVLRGKVWKQFQSIPTLETILRHPNGLFSRSDPDAPRLNFEVEAKTICAPPFILNNHEKRKQDGLLSVPHGWTKRNNVTPSISPPAKNVDAPRRGGGGGANLDAVQ